MIGNHQDEHLLGAVASALVATDEIRNMTAFEMPYPPRVQSALDQIVLHCLRRQALPPKSVSALVRWGYERPLGAWPLTLPGDVYPLNEFLVDMESGAPTALCREIALCAETGSPLHEVRRQMVVMAGLAAERNQDWAFRALRGLLARYPVITIEQLYTVRFDVRLGVLDEHLGDFFQQIGPEYAVDGEVFPCGRCGNALRPTTTDSWWCEREECQTGNKVYCGEPLDWDAKVLVQMDTRHRQFVSGPARAVLRIADDLTLPGVTVWPWPVSGSCDLRVEVPGGPVWAVVVVDWHSPALLGKAVALFGADSRVWVVAQYRVDADPGYLQAVREHAMMPTGTPLVYSEKEFTDLVLGHARESGHA